VTRPQPCARHRGQPTKDILGTKDFGKDILIAKPVLETYENGTLIGQVGQRKRNLAGRRALALHQHDIGLFNTRGIMRDGNLPMPVPAKSGNAKPVPAYGLDMVLIRIDKRHLKPAFGKNGTKQRAHPASPDDGHMANVPRHPISPVIQYLHS
jgi:hypothetical protein